MIGVFKMHDPKKELPDLGGKLEIDTVIKTLPDGLIRTIPYTKYGWNTSDFGDYFNDKHRFADDEVAWWAVEDELKVVDL